MRPGSKISIAGMMRLIALLALEMAMFQRVLFLVVIPPVTMGVVSLNLAVLYALRLLPAAIARRIGGLLSGGLIALFVLVGYYLTADPRNPTFGVGGKALGTFLNGLAASRPDPSAPLSDLLRFGARWAQVAEIILLDVGGLAIIWFGGWMDSRRRPLPETRAP